MISNTLYDILNKIQRWLPAVGIFYLTIAKIWNLPLGSQINETVLAVCTLFAAFLEVSTSQYNKKYPQGNITNRTDG